jgi:hypothetical protein
MKKTVKPKSTKKTVKKAEKTIDKEALRRDVERAVNGQPKKSLAITPGVVHEYNLNLHQPKKEKVVYQPLVENHFITEVVSLPVVQKIKPSFFQSLKNKLASIFKWC